VISLALRAPVDVLDLAYAATLLASDLTGRAVAKNYSAVRLTILRRSLAVLVCRVASHSFLE
jgi:hypothetical protein